MGGGAEILPAINRWRACELRLPIESLKSVF
jgi:hypothetical protein